MKFFRHIPLAAAMLIATAASFMPVQAFAASKSPLWEVVEDFGSASHENLPLQQVERFDVSVHEGRIYITVTEPVKIEVYTILGQIVTSRNLKPGVVRLTLGSRGIYLIKGAGSTRRVNL